METATLNTPTSVVTKDELLASWLGHRKLTRKVIEAFPEDQLFSHSIGGMRTFSAILQEILGISGPGLREIVTGKTEPLEEHIKEATSKENILKLWDNATADIIKYWNQIPAERFSETVRTFGQYDGTILSSIQYFIDNEIHHRAQGYVYLRSLGIQPPAFWDRY